jgi:glutaconyl-CoA decarboxylase
MGPVTTNPWLIALINMTIVFGVLIALGAMMSVLQIIDPTKKKLMLP